MNASMALDNEILLHQKDDHNQSYLSRAVSWIWNGGSDNTLKQLEQLKSKEDAALKSGNQTEITSLDSQINQAIKKDQSALESRDTVGNYASGAVQTAGLFLSGRLGMASTMGLYALGQAKPDSSLGGQLTDATLGAAQGLILKKTFEFAGSRGWNPAVQGMVIGGVSRLSGLTLNRQTYMDGNGNITLNSFESGLLNSAKQAADPKMLAIDGATFAAASGLLKGANVLSGGKLMDSALARTMATGTTFGFLSGSANEFTREQSMGQGFNLGKILKSGAIQGAIDTFAAAPGGMQAEAAAGRPLARTGEIQPQTDSTSTAAPRQFMVTDGQNQLARFMNGGNHDQAMITARELLDSAQQKYGDPKQIFVRHIDETAKPLTSLGPQANAADLVAACFPETLDADARSKFVLGPQAQGKVFLNADSEGNRIAFSQEPLSQYDRSLQLGQDSFGQKAQDELYRFIFGQNGAEVPGISRDLLDLRNMRAQVQSTMASQGWTLHQSFSGSPADAVGMDFILFNKKTGDYHFLDPTLDLDSKANISALRQQGVVHIRVDRADLNSPTLDTKMDFMQQLLDTMNGPRSILNAREIPPPSTRADLTAEQKQASVQQFQDALGRKITALEAEARKASGSDSQLLWQQAEMLRDYARDVSKTRIFMDKRTEEKSPEYERHQSAVSTRVGTLARQIVSDIVNGRHTNTSSKPIARGNFVTADTNRDSLTVRTKDERFTFSGVDPLLSKLISDAVGKKQDISFDLKRKLLSGSTVDEAKRRLRLAIESIPANELIGEPKPPGSGPRPNGGNQPHPR